MIYQAQRARSPGDDQGWQRTERALPGLLRGRRLILNGRVQGLGVRPAIHRLATELHLLGTVRNTHRGVEIELEGIQQQLILFSQRLRAALPAECVLEMLYVEDREPTGCEDFHIVADDAAGPLAVQVPPDRGMCKECLTEIFDAGDRRHRYPLTSCTVCGPRYSIIDRMPYERAQTAMSKFPLCRPCQSEYENPGNRRFHAQTNACAECGPQVWCVDRNCRIQGRGDDAVQLVGEALRRGLIVALRGVGGYQLLADASDEEAVQRLRTRKGRVGKPLAVMVDSVETARQCARLDTDELRALTDASNPIVLLSSRGGALLAPAINPGLDSVGLLLPTTPLHALLARAIDRPLVCTSGNLEGDPLEFTVDAAEKNLAGICDLWLHHDRPITRPIDDSVVRVVGGRSVTIRLARGLAPLTLPDLDLRPGLALGGHLKCAGAWSNGDQAALGPHVGDLESLAARTRWLAHLQDMEQLYRFEPQQLVHDLHPDYFTTQWAAETGKRLQSVQHHHAHILAGMLEHGWLDRPVLGVAWDGTGYGPDGTIWGGEFLIVRGSTFQRLARLRPFRLPGGEVAIREPWRVALAVAAETRPLAAAADHWLANLDVPQRAAVEAIRGHPRFSPLTSSAGRLFDAAAAIVLGAHDAEFDGQPAMRMEAAADRSAEGQYDFPVRRSKISELDWRPLFAGLLVDHEAGVDPATMSMRFHRSLAAGIAAVCRRSELPIVLAGGVFQNRLLVELLLEHLPEAAGRLGLPGRIPPNDGGLAAGQLAYAAALDAQ